MKLRSWLAAGAAVAIPIVGATDCQVIGASATHGNATYTCVDGAVAELVHVSLATLTANFDTADFSLGGTHLARLERPAPGVDFYVPVGTLTVDGKYDGPHSHAAGPVPITVTGARPDCTPATTTPAPTTSSPPPTVPLTVATTAPASSTTRVTHPSSSVPPGPTTPSTSGHTLPATGPSDVLNALLGGLATFFLGGLVVISIAVSRRRRA